MDEKKTLKDVELSLIAELMKNSRRSDRELARALGVSQPTISRTIKKLEKEGYIKEYTAIPDFKKLGFSILSFSLTKLKRDVSQEAIEKKRKEMHELLEREPIPEILHMNGMGFGADKVLVAMHADYASYVSFMNRLKANPLLEINQINSFLVNLDDESHFRTFTFSEVANYLLKMKKKE
jgi:Lrp/AsnC family leucine-responsive transcriptional regulator